MFLNEWSEEYIPNILDTMKIVLGGQVCVSKGLKTHKLITILKS